MNKKRSQIQYFFSVDLQPRSELHGVALLGHQTLAELHDSISGTHGGSADASFSFRVGSQEIEERTTLDDLNLTVGQKIEYTVKSIDENRYEVITVDFIDDE